MLDRRHGRIGRSGHGRATTPGRRPGRHDAAPGHLTHNRAERTAADPHAEQLAAAYRNHRLDLYRFAQRRLGDPALADEAVQETSLKAWRSIHRYDPAAGSTRMWLIGICRHAVVDVARKRTRDHVAQQ